MPFIPRPREGYPPTLSASALHSHYSVLLVSQLTMCLPDTLRKRGQPQEEEEIGYSLTRRVVSHHNTANDAWVIHNGGVYDVTLFLSSHPGGEEVLQEHLGSDISDRMNGTHQHSDFAYNLLSKYRIGTLKESRVMKDGCVDEDEQLVNWDEPILHQVGVLGDKYQKWIHSFPTTDHTVKMFTQDSLENLTKCPWYMPLLFWIPIIFVELVHYVQLLGGISNIQPFIFLLSALTGVVCWLLFEYTLHRYIFHIKTSGYFSNIFHFLIHGHHHITPMDLDRLVFPPVPAMIIAAPIWYSAPRLLGVAIGYPWLIGFALGYLMYDMTHFWIHSAVPTSTFLKMQKRRHVHHHYFRPSVNFGISNPLFDYVFGTIVEPST